MTMLARDELPASGARLLTHAQRHALVGALTGNLTRDRAGWRDHEGNIVKHQTVRHLVADGYLVLTSRTGERRQHTARLTTRGDWYARSILTLHPRRAQS